MPSADLTIALRTALLDDPVVRHKVDVRVKPDELDQGASLPAICYEALSDRQQDTLSGKSTLRLARVQYDCYANTRAEADALGREVERVLNGLIGGVHGVFVDDCLVDNSYARQDRPAQGSAAVRYRRTIDVNVSYQAAALPA